MTAGVAAPAEQLTAECPGIEIDTSTLTRSLYAYDASNYRVTPQAVAFPRDRAEVEQILRTANRLGLAVTARGSGTSMAGNAIGPGVVLDLARHLRAIRTIDIGNRTATVESGVLLDTLQERARADGLMFGPDPSSHSRVSFGGMVGNDACGNHSVAYGRTSDHVVELEAVLADGTPVRATRGALHALRVEDTARVARLESGLRDLAGEHLATLRTELGQVPRQVSGYHLHRLLPERGFDVAKALVGSEGTFVVVTAVTVALVPRPVTTTMLVVGYDDLVVAAQDVPAILTFEPSAIEAMDETIVAALRQRRGNTPDLPDARSWLYIELDDDRRDRVDALLAEIEAAGRVRGVRRVDDPAERVLLWRIREDGAGLAANLPGEARAWPGWEDAAVAPERLADYLRDFRILLAEHGFHGVLYGHFGAGCVHVRIDFDRSSDAGRERMAAFVRAAASLVARHGGTVSGEHGDGRARSELLQLMYTPETIAIFGRAKELFDPAGTLNPGVIVQPLEVTADLQAPIVPFTRSPLAFVADEGDLSQAVDRCIGVGRCVAPVGGVMCPSYRATGREQDSTRGRARALQDFLGGTAPATADDVLETLDLCLSCKACAKDCPTGVDMASYKSAFLQSHYRHRLRPRTHYTLGWLPTLTRLAAPFAAVANRIVAVTTLRRFIARVAGITTERRFPRLATRRDRAALPTSSSRAPKAVLFIDTFTRAFRPDIAAAATRVLSDAGVPVAVAPSGCCGLTWVTTGQLGTARRVLRRTLGRLSENHPDLPIIVLEPSCAAAFVGDAPELVDTADAHAVADRVITFEVALRTLARKDWAPPALASNAVLQTHCHERSTLRGSDQAGALRRSGVDHVDEPVGCCGLAGNFGFEAPHYETSMAVAEVALAPAVRAADEDAVLVADGFSCRTQIDHLTGESGRAKHLAELLDEAITRR